MVFLNVKVSKLSESFIVFIIFEQCANNRGQDFQKLVPGAVLPKAMFRQMKNLNLKNFSKIHECS